MGRKPICEHTQCHKFQIIHRCECTSSTVLYCVLNLLRSCSVLYYRPQRSWAKVMFLQASVILSTGEGCLPQCMLGCPPPSEQTPHPPPPPGADSGIRPTSGRYASYWNALLFRLHFKLFVSFKFIYLQIYLVNTLVSSLLITEKLK